MNFNNRLERLTKCFVASIVLVNTINAVSAQESLPGAKATALVPLQQLADDTLIVVTNPNADTRKLRTDLLNEAQATTVRELHANRDNWSILHLQPKAGQRESTLGKINGMLGHHPEIAGVTRNYLLRKFAQSPPNDSDFSQQWTLANLNWPAAQAADQGLQRGPAHYTVIASGVNAIPTNGELGSNIQQFNASIPGTVTPEPLHCVDAGPFGDPGEGDIDCQVGGCLTDNSTLLAGAASFGPYPVNITMLRAANTRNPGGITEAALDNALIWALNNQAKRGGPGAINISYGVPFGTNAQGVPFVPLWRGPDILSFAKTCSKRGDIMVISAGDGPGTWAGKNAQIVPGLCVVQGSDQNNALVNTLPADIYGTGAGLTTVQGDPIAAPGSVQPCLGATVGSQTIFLPADFYGTSFSAPFISATIALLISINPSLTGQQAFNIIVRTGTHAGAPTPLVTPSWPVVVPNFAAAIQAASGH